MARLAFQDDEDHPARLIGLSDGGLGVSLEQGLVQWCEQRFEAFQTTGHGARRHVETEQPPVVQQAFRGAMTEELVEQDLHPHRHPQQPFGNQFGC